VIGETEADSWFDRHERSFLSNGLSRFKVFVPTVPIVPDVPIVSGTAGTYGTTGTIGTVTGYRVQMYPFS
jgi:hypothetical protein